MNYNSGLSDSEIEWSSLTGAKTESNTQDAAIIYVLDKVLKSSSFATGFKAVMLSNNVFATYKSIHGTELANTDKNVAYLYGAVQKATVPVLSTGMSLIQQSLAMPNIAGIPISAARVTTNREIEISESMVIVQSNHSREYWTDNSVPRLKEWTIEGYLSSASPLDSGWVIKPSLQWQIYYLDVCAKSRRPVLFKTNRGEFVNVQITTLNTTEEASYNNHIGITISLKEYNPYIVEGVPSQKKFPTLKG